MLQKEDNDWVKKSISVPEVGQTGQSEVVQKNSSQAHKLNREDDMDCTRWRKQIKDGFIVGVSE